MMDGWTVVIQLNSLAKNIGGSQCSQCVTDVLMRTNPIRPRIEGAKNFASCQQSVTIGWVLISENQRVSSANSPIRNTFVQ